VVSHSAPFYRELRDRNAAFDERAGYRITMMEIDARQRLPTNGATWSLATTSRCWTFGRRPGGSSAPTTIGFRAPAPSP
jgi:hypothetical protein